VVGRLSAGSAPSLAALAQEAGFADQAHLARNFRELAGVSITAWLAERHELSDLLLAGPDAS
jgi:AraC-like DNA-binding protein